jgi:hypothetical protein
MKTNPIFDFIKLCDKNKDTKKTGLILGRSKTTQFEDSRTIEPFKSLDFFPLDRLISIGHIKKGKISDNLDEFAVNNSSGIIIKLPKRLTTNLCKLAGALCADGYIHESYRANKCQYIIELDDKDEVAVHKFSDWFFSEFGYHLKVKKDSRYDMWSIDVGNKIIGRFLCRIIGLQSGKKSSTVRQPLIIERADLRFQRAFWTGFLTFDGATNISGTIELLSRSRYIIRSFEKFLKKEGLTVRTHTDSDKNGYWRIHASKPSRPQLGKWLRLFEKDTRAWKRVFYSFHDYERKALDIHDAIKTFSYLYPPSSSSKTSLVQVLLSIANLRSVSNSKLAESLQIDRDTVRKYRKILSKAKIIKVTKPIRRGQEMTIHFQDNPKEWMLPR